MEFSHALHGVKVGRNTAESGGPDTVTGNGADSLLPLPGDTVTGRAYSLYAWPAVTSGGPVTVTGNELLLPLPKKTTLSLVVHVGAYRTETRARTPRSPGKGQPLSVRSVPSFMTRLPATSSHLTCSEAPSLTRNENHLSFAATATIRGAEPTSCALVSNLGLNAGARILALCPDQNAPRSSKGRLDVTDFKGGLHLTFRSRA